MQNQVYPHIVTDPEVFAGRPTIEGTQTLVSTLIEQIAAGRTIEEVARENGVSSDDVRAALSYGAKRVDEKAQPNETGHVGRQNSSMPTQHEMKAESELGKRLAAIHARIVADGTPLLSWDALDAQMDEARRRTLDEP